MNPHERWCPLRTFAYEVGSGEEIPKCVCRRRQGERRVEPEPRPLADLAFKGWRIRMEIIAWDGKPFDMAVLQVGTKEEAVGEWPRAVRRFLRLPEPRRVGRYDTRRSDRRASAESPRTAVLDSAVGEEGGGSAAGLVPFARPVRAVQIASTEPTWVVMDAPAGPGGVMVCWCYGETARERAEFIARTLNAEQPR